MARSNGAAIRVIRERTGLTVPDVIKLLAELNPPHRVSEDHLYNVELGYKKAGPKLIAALAKALQCPQTALLGPDTPPERRTA